MKRWMWWASNAAFGLVIAVVVALFVLPTVFSSRLAIVRSGSMGPALPVGSLAFMKPVDPATIRIGDVVVFHPPEDEDATVSHRVREVLDNGFVTKGDAVQDSDPFIVPPANVVGRVSWRVPLLGYVLSYTGRVASSVWGFCLLICLPAIVVIGSAARDVYRMSGYGKRRARLLNKRAKWLARRTSSPLHRRMA